MPRHLGLKLRPLFGTLCAVLVIIRDFKHHLLEYFVFHIIGETARLVGAFAAVLSVVIHFWMMGRLLALFFARSKHRVNHQY